MNTDFTNDIEQCLQVLNEGGIILYPTDTIWGLGCDATNAAAVDKIMALKQRPPFKSFVVLVAEERDVLQYAASVDLAVFDYVQQQQKPVTVIYEHAVNLAENVLADDGSVAIRICNEAFCRTLIKRFRKPIVSTSANISGQPSPAFYRQVDMQVVNGVDYVVQYRQEEEMPSTPSAIVKWKDGQVEIIRP
jgi:L-threonylcarbamoyladenylate synthase